MRFLKGSRPARIKTAILLHEISKSEDYWDDGWVGPRFVTKLSPYQRTSLFRLEGWRPEGSSPATVSISLGGSKLCTEEIEGGTFVIEAQAQILSKDETELEITTSHWSNAENDLRDLSFILRRVDFF